MTPIIYDQWETLGEKWETGNPIPNCTHLFITCDHIAAFFREVVEKRINSNFVVISAASDYGPHYQSEHPPHLDFHKWFPMIGDLSGLNYRDLFVHGRLDGKKCLESDRFSVKSYSWTHSTFNVIPNIEWYCTNLNIDEPNCHAIPFGLDMESYELIQKYKNLSKKDRIFCCFENNTNERVLLKRQYSRNSNFMVVDKLPKDEYIRLLCSSSHVMCPTGNGLDSYRILETIYSGGIPIVERGRWSKFYENFGVMYFDSDTPTARRHELLDFSYWRDLIS